MSQAVITLIGQLSITLVVLILYTVLTITHNDGTPVLAILAGQGASIGVQIVGNKTSST